MGKHHQPRPRGYEPGGFRFPPRGWMVEPRFVGANDLARPVVTPFDSPRVGARDMTPIVVPRRHGVFRRSWMYGLLRQNRRAA
jgi:hypothetical protein